MLLGEIVWLCSVVRKIGCTKSLEAKQKQPQLAKSLAYEISINL